MSTINDSVSLIKAGLSRKELNTMIADSEASLAGLREIYSDGHPIFTQEKWRYSVQCGDTLDGYWIWAYAGIKEVKSMMTPEDYARAFGLPG